LEVLYILVPESVGGPNLGPRAGVPGGGGSV